MTFFELTKAQNMVVAASLQSVECVVNVLHFNDGRRRFFMILAP